MSLMAKPWRIDTLMSTKPSAQAVIMVQIHSQSGRISAGGLSAENRHKVLYSCRACREVEEPLNRARCYGTAAACCHDLLFQPDTSVAPVWDLQQPSPGLNPLETASPFLGTYLWPQVSPGARSVSLNPRL